MSGRSEDYEEDGQVNIIKSSHLKDQQASPGNFNTIEIDSVKARVDIPRHSSRSINRLKDNQQSSSREGRPKVKTGQAYKRERDALAGLLGEIKSKFKAF